jgi:flagellar motor switch protein FliM
MADEFLSQDEVDALLKGVAGDANEEKAEPGKGDVRPYDLAKQERIVRGRMPTLEIINERFARNLRIGLFNFMHRTAEISLSPVRTQKYSEFIRNLAVPTNLNIVAVKPLRGLALFVFDPTLVFLVVDHLFGSDGRFHTRVEGREFTPTEQRIIQRLLELTFENYEKAWESVRPLKFEYVRAEINTQFANIATPNEVVVTTSINIEIAANVSGSVHICLPYSMIEPIRDVLCSPVQGEQIEQDERWVRMLSQQLQTAEVDLVCNLLQIPVTLQQILEMKAGDVVTAEPPELVTATVDGIPVMECRYGKYNGHYALKVVRMLNGGGEDAAPRRPASVTPLH